jgi:hypothetical protein
MTTRIEYGVQWVDYPRMGWQIVDQYGDGYLPDTIFYNQADAWAAIRALEAEDERAAAASAAGP